MTNHVELELSAVFKIDSKRDLLIPDREFFMADMRPAVDLAKKELVTHGIEFSGLASWNKVEHFPAKAKGFLVKFIQGLELGMIDALNVDYQFQASGLRPRHKHLDSDSGNKINVSMLFHGGSIRNVNLIDISEIYQQALGSGIRIVTLCGGSLTNASKKFSNHNAQKEIKKIIGESAAINQDVLIIAANMGQRSFSIPGLGVVYLCYDRGQEGATRQKLSRVLTQDTLDKVGRIVSCSFDPNRDDKLDAEIFATADHISDRKGISWIDSLKFVLSTNSPFYKFSESGAIPILPDQYMSDCVDQRRAHRQIGAMLNISLFDTKTLTEWANSNADYSRNNKNDTIDSGSTWNKNKPKKIKTQKSTYQPISKEEKQERVLARAAIISFLENFHYIKESTNKKTVKEILDEIRESKDDQDWLFEYFGISIGTIDRSFHSGGLNYKHLELALSI